MSNLQHRRPARRLHRARGHGRGRRVLEAVGERFGHTFQLHRGPGRRRRLRRLTASTCRSRPSRPAPRPTRSSRAPSAGLATRLTTRSGRAWSRTRSCPCASTSTSTSTCGPSSCPTPCSALSPVKEEFVKGTDMLILRELISGIYFGPRGDRAWSKARRRSRSARSGTPRSTTSTRSSAIARDGFKLARSAARS